MIKIEDIYERLYNFKIGFKSYIEKFNRIICRNILKLLGGDNLRFLCFFMRKR